MLRWGLGRRDPRGPPNTQHRTPHPRSLARLGGAWRAAPPRPGNPGQGGAGRGAGILPRVRRVPGVPCAAAGAMKRPSARSREGQDRLPHVRLFGPRAMGGRRRTRGEAPALREAAQGAGRSAHRAPGPKSRSACRGTQGDG